MASLALLAGFVSLPLLSLVVWTIDEGAWRAMASPVAVDALLLSVRTTAITMAILLLVGTPAAYVLARIGFRGSRAFNTLIDVPVVLPPSAAGIALLLAFGRLGLVGQYLNVFGITLSFTTAAVVMAEVFVAAPFYIRQAATGFSAVDRKVEEAAVGPLFRSPRHPYTQGLLGSMPKLGSSLTGDETRLAEIPGLVPSLKQKIPGCVFASRCPKATDLCVQVAPALEEKAPGHTAACHYAVKEGAVAA